MKRPRRGLTLEQAIAELERLGAEVRSMTTQLVSLRARVTDLEQWEKDIAAASIRKHVGKRVRKHGGLKIRKH
jgi:prefoldin subunit 5